MADYLTADERSERMSRVLSRGNRATELRLIKLMREHHITGWRRGAPLPGKPDFVFRAEKVAVFVDGCFWHGCPRHARMPKSRVAFWKAKLTANQVRDQLVTRTLRLMGWRVLRIWEHELARKNEARLLSRLRHSGISVNPRSSAVQEASTSPRPSPQRGEVEFFAASASFCGNESVCLRVHPWLKRIC